MIIAGDFNFSKVKWKDDGTVSVFGAENNPGELFVDNLADHGLTQFVTSPTLIQTDCQLKNTLDLVI